jgi:hypothetical protein
MLGQFSRLAVYVRGDRRHASDGVGGDHRGENMDMHVGSEPWSVQKRGIPCKPRLSMLSLETRTDSQTLASPRVCQGGHVLVWKRFHPLSRTRQVRNWAGTGAMRYKARRGIDVHDDILTE